MQIDYWPKTAIVGLSFLLCFGCNKSAPPPDPRIAELEAEIKKLKSGDKSLEAAKKAMRELKKINSIIEMGISYQDYSRTLIETKPAFDEAVSDVPAGNLKLALLETMKGYIDAGTFWNLWIVGSEGYYTGTYPPGTRYFKKEDVEQFAIYKLPWGNDGISLYGNKSMITDIWRVAAEGLST